jgi:hypothetical protein
MKRSVPLHPALSEEYFSKCVPEFASSRRKLLPGNHVATPEKEKATPFLCQASSQFSKVIIKKKVITPVYLPGKATIKRK